MVRGALRDRPAPVDEANQRRWYMSARYETTLVIVGGAPASGKSTISRQLSDDLQIPAFGKDDFKEVLFDSIGYRDREWSRHLGRASHELLVLCARKLIAKGESCIIESTFRPDDALLFEQLRHSHPARMIQIFCHAPLEEMCERFRHRASGGSRHPGHCDESNGEELIRLIESGNFVPLEIDGQLIQINTGAASRHDFQSQYQSILSSFA